MPTTAELNDDIRAARQRHNRMRQAVEDLDRRIQSLEREQAAAKPRERARFLSAIKNASEQRLSALELLAEAEAQTAKQVQRLTDAMATAKKELGKTARLCGEAAGRFDQAMQEALGALVEIETAADPIRPFLPDGIGTYTHMRNVTAALRYAFAPRLCAAERTTERKSMSERVGEMIASARHNSTERDQ